MWANNYVNPMYKMSFYKTKYKLYTTSLNILKCCNTFKTFHIQLGINSVKSRPDRCYIKYPTGLHQLMRLTLTLNTK